jgi:AcrR family transcriptional regulator
MYGIEANEEARCNDQSSDRDSRVSILDTTYGLIGTTPYDKLSMQHIAHSVGVSKALLFYFFKSKRELVRESLIWGTRQEMKAFHTLSDPEQGGSGEYVVRFDEMVTHWMNNSIERIQILHTYFEVTDLEDPDDIVNVELKQFFGHIIGYFERILRENGLNYPREQAALMALMIDTFGFLPHLTPEPFDTHRYREAFLDLFGMRGKEWDRRNIDLDDRSDNQDTKIEQGKYER